jgi:hypothetical protein
MTNATMTIEQKRELINNDSNNAYHLFINKENHQMWSAFRWVATNTITEIDGCATITESAIAGKYALLAMLQLELI